MTAPSPAFPQIRVRRLSDVQTERVRWLSRGRLAAGKLSMLDGDPGLGKSTLLADWAGRISRGDPLPDGESQGPRGVVLLTAEDGLGDTVRPRLEAAGADLTRILAFEAIVDDPDDPGRLPAIPDDLLHVEAAIREGDAALLIIDPLVAYLGPGVNSMRDQDVRRALAPLTPLMERTGVAVVGVRHLNKQALANALYRGGGSIAFVAAARCGMLLAADPEDQDRRILASSKSNLAAPPASLAFRLEAVAGTDVAAVRWEAGSVAYTADELLRSHLDEGEAEEREDAAAWLRDVLAGGPLPAGEVLAAGRRAGHSERTLKRAKKAAGVRSEKSGFGGGGEWRWALATESDDAPGDHAAGPKEPLRSQSGPAHGGDPLSPLSAPLAWANGLHAATPRLPAPANGHHPAEPGNDRWTR